MDMAAKGCRSFDAGVTSVQAAKAEKDVLVLVLASLHGFVLVYARAGLL
jgi:hypothetical protein